MKEEGIKAQRGCHDKANHREFPGSPIGWIINASGGKRALGNPEDFFFPRFPPYLTEVQELEEMLCGALLKVKSFVRPDLRGRESGSYGGEGTGGILRFDKEPLTCGPTLKKAAQRVHLRFAMGQFARDAEFEQCQACELPVFFGPNFTDGDVAMITDMVIVIIFGGLVVGHSRRGYSAAAEWQGEK